MAPLGIEVGVLRSAVLSGAAGALLVLLRALVYLGAPQLGLQSVQCKDYKLETQRAGSEQW